MTLIIEEMQKDGISMLQLRGLKGGKSLLEINLKNF
jgi:hypothetical protein